MDSGRKLQWGTPTKKWYGKKPDDGRGIYETGDRMYPARGDAVHLSLICWVCY
jgi:hypothetical protein